MNNSKEFKLCKICGDRFFKRDAYPNIWPRKKICEKEECKKEHQRILGRRGDLKRKNNPKRRIWQNKYSTLRYRRNHPLKKTNCINCSAPFQQKIFNQKYCSKECIKQYWYKNNKVYKPIKEKSCLMCGTKFKTHMSAHKFCSKKCSNIFDYLSKKEHYNKLSRERYKTNKKKNELYSKLQYQKAKEKEILRRKLLGLPSIYKSEDEMRALLDRFFPDTKKYDNKYWGIVNGVFRRLGQQYGGLQLDRFYPNIKTSIGRGLAFEYQGRQHFEECFMNKQSIYVDTEEKFRAQQWRDQKTKEICQEAGIVLIEINYKEKLSEQLIFKKLQKNGLCLIINKTLVCETKPKQ